MKFYFNLQIRRFSRAMSALGLHPLLAVLLLAISFLALSLLVFYKLSYGAYVLVGIAILSLLQLGNKSHTDQLQSIFNNTTTNKIRLVENGVMSLPFFAILTFQSEFLLALGLLPIAIVLAFFRSGSMFNFTIPTPFKKLPFEFIVGFRNTFWLIGIAYFLIGKGIQIDNFNLSLVSFGFLFLIGMSYYFYPENRHFVWIFKHSPTEFLLKKLKNGFICISIVTVLPLIALLFFYSENWWLILIVAVFGYIYLTSMILAKYSAFPKEMNAPQAILYGLSLWFPPMLLLVIPIFYKKSKKQLQAIL